MRTVRFTEEMNGFFEFGSPAFDTGFELGRADGSSLMFHLTIGTADVDGFLRDPEHVATAEGWVEGPRLGPGRLPVDSGTFNLLVPGDRPHRLAMRYRLWFRDGEGADRTLLGVKDIGNDPGFDMWKDTTSLMTQIVAGRVEQDGEGEVLGRGMLHLTPSMFAHQLTTMRGSPMGIARFGTFFAGGLLGEYCSRRWQHRTASQ